MLRKSSGRHISQTAVRAMVIIFLTRLFDNGLRFLPIGKEPAIQTFCPKGAVEALDKSVLPRTAWLDIALHNYSEVAA
jgi:hypothetical protein